MEDLISAIIPVYNVEKYLPKCIDSIIDQIYKNLEIILVDDGSKDNSSKICDEYSKKDNRIKVIHKENGGVSSARNEGIKIAKGNWISFIDSDDWLEKDFFTKLLESANKEKADVAIAGYNRVTENKIEKINANGEEHIYTGKEYLIKTLNPQTGFGFCHMKLFKAECIKNKYFNEKIKVGEDALFNEQISENINKAVFVEQALYNYRINSESLVKKYDINYANKYLNSMQINKEFILDKYKKDEEIIQNYYNFVAYHVLLVAVNYCFHPDNTEKNKRKLLKQICNYEEFKEAIKKSNYNNISITRKITLFTLKCKMYLITEFICKYRQKQNKKV